MQKAVSPKLVSLAFGILTVSFLAVFAVFAWTEPTVAPPGGNVPAPVNVGSVEQIKSGNLTVNALGVSASGNALLVPNGNVGIGTASPGAKLDVQGGNIRTGGDFLTASGEGNCPIWKDCDGDGKTGGTGDCDESCADCFVGSTKSTMEHDGKDQNCDLNIDEPGMGPQKDCTGYGSQSDGTNCQWVVENALAATCDQYCTSIGRSRVVSECTGYPTGMSPFPSQFYVYYLDAIPYLLPSVNFSTCQKTNVTLMGLVISRQCYLGTQAVCGVDGGARCICSGNLYQ